MRFFDSLHLARIRKRVYKKYAKKYVSALLTKDGALVGKSKRVHNPEFRVGWRSRLARDLGTLFAEFSPRSLPGSVPPIDCTVLIKTTTVSTDQDGNERPDAFRSSKVDRVVGWADCVGFDHD